MLTDEEVKHIAKLARLKLSDSEVERLGKQISGVLDYVNILAEVDTAGVQETSQVTGLQNVMADDVVLKSPASREELLACSELPVDSKQVRVIKIMK
ncbi:MAG: Asp-tRNA(Asn)/Glu-tRNA(Gln) amidotransferase subunit GatC [Patescibacteria group bacterium]